MSRSGYSDDCENLALWRRAVENAIKGKRGQAILKEMEAALLSLPQKRLTAYEVANPGTGDVCAIGAVALKRRLDKGMDRLKALEEIDKVYPEGCEADEFMEEFDVAGALLREITYINDESQRHDSPEKRYEKMLEWVRENIVKV